VHPCVLKNLFLLVVFLVFEGSKYRQTVYVRAGEPMAHVPKMACRKISLARGIQCCPFFFLISFAHSLCLYVCIHNSDCTEIVCELLLLPNNTLSETLLHKLGVV